MIARAHALATLLSFAALGIGCGRQSGAAAPSGPNGNDDCGDIVTAMADADLVTVGQATPAPSIVWIRGLGTQPVSAGHVYAVIDQDGLVGTMMTINRENRCSALQTVGGCSGGEEWSGKWVAPPPVTWKPRDPQRLIAVGPVDEHFGAARRLPATDEVTRRDDEKQLTYSVRARTESWERLVGVGLARQPSSIEVWGRRCANNTASVRETRLMEGGRARVVHRVIVRDDEVFAGADRRVPSDATVTSASTPPPEPAPEPATPTVK